MTEAFEKPLAPKRGERLSRATPGASTHAARSSASRRRLPQPRRMRVPPRTHETSVGGLVGNATDVWPARDAGLAHARAACRARLAPDDGLSGAAARWAPLAERRAGRVAAGRRAPARSVAGRVDGGP